MPSPRRQIVTTALFEAFFVVLGVVLALAANEWRQDRADRAHADRALAAIAEELRSNREGVLAAGEYHEERMSRIYGRGPQEPRLEARDFPRGFISPARVFRTAWDTAGETGALEHLDYAKVLALSRVYASQDRYEHQARTAGELIYAELFRGGTEAIVANQGNLAMVIGTFAYRERELVAEYDSLLVHLEGAR
ncbi:MAG TPA: hypothetical protein PLL30_09105 [Candidatus Krumholzibacteria bacterium]|nr:hypothetical protein [Candidatus Krumholzibacteria bacterium]HPD71918.1 hypothetical protein [Candidatus Krumholzibacteria bacterium]HRY41149.1 hypothetical protein [Candidatus Krumholzibacteria bacterium]